MNQADPLPHLPRQRLAAPKAAAIAGIIFSVLLIISLSLLLGSIPANPQEGGAWLSSRGNTMLLAFNLVPFASIAFLWFIGVVRDRLGENEDRFIATVFLGSGLLFLALLLTSAAITGGIIALYNTYPDRLIASGFYDFGRITARELINTYAIKMAGVFMISTCTLFLRTRAMPRWIAFLGYALALLMLLRLQHIDRLGWVALAFPLWVLLLSVYILMDNFRVKSRASSV